MKVIKRRRSIYAVFSSVAVFLTVMFIAIEKPAAAIALAAVSALSLIIFSRESRMLYCARLICDNRILTLPSAVVTIEKCAGERMRENTVVSTFGMMVGTKVFKWGCDGIHGVRLQNVRMDREHIRLTFGVNDKKQSAVLLHGMTDRESVQEIARKIFRETGVKPEVSDW